MARTHALRGILAMLMSVGFFAGMDALLKLLAQRYPALQVSALRGAASIPFVLLPVLVTGRWRALRPVNWRLHLLRGLLAIVMLTTFVYSVRLLPLADAYSVFLAAPLIVTALSVPLLGERVDAKRWLAIGIGMSGTLALLNPRAANLVTLGAAAAIVSALCYALSGLSVRVLTRTDTTVSMVFWFMLMLAVFGGVLAAPSWVPVAPEHWPVLAGVGLLGALGQHFVTEAFRHAPASVVAPFEYTALLWAVALDWLFWHHAPNMRMFIGGAIIIGSGLYLIYRVRRERLQPATPIRAHDP
ncbi:MAG TPA: DMT family transporter [Steroidobacteraceae bacterium]|nr:DMT family transporter [Steroidobacteraceae bacterium]